MGGQDADLPERRAVGHPVRPHEGHRFHAPIIPPGERSHKRRRAPARLPPGTTNARRPGGTWFTGATGACRGRAGQAAGAGNVGYSTPETCWTTRMTWQE
ncbi:hypothetical protein GCM10010335_11960 [Streptomyces galbus]|nr:hypothetical protein GCM10010335_11960 [Streptomyces galbus]